MALAGYPLGLEFCFLDRSRAAPAAPLGEFIEGELNDAARLTELAGRVDAVTFEIENIDADALRCLNAPLMPPLAALAAAQDRLAEKQLFASLGIPAAAYRLIDSEDDLEAAVDGFELPGVLKARRLGYDGRGQRFVTAAEQLATAWAELGRVPALIESLIRFDRELSLIAVRDQRREIRFYPLAHNTHRDGILRLTRAPFEAPPLADLAQGYLRAIMEHLDYVGVLTVEFFQTGDTLLANEMAPRVHNSGHWTIEGAVTSQFENHLRAIAGLPLGSTAPVGHAAMVNIIGHCPPAGRLLEIPRLHLHDYGKRPRPGRKIGHCTLIGEHESDLEHPLMALRELLEA